MLNRFIKTKYMIRKSFKYGIIEDRGVWCNLK